MTLGSFDHCILTMFCDSISTAIVHEACCIRTVALHSVAELINHPKSLAPLAAFIDASATTGEASSDAIRVIHNHWPSCAVIVFISAHADDQMERAFADGAHDVIRKPLRIPEILVRMQVRMRNLIELRKHQEMAFGDLKVNVIQKRIKCGDSEHQFPSTTFNVLMSLLEASDTTVSRYQLRRRVWDDVHVADGAMDRQIHEIRKTLRSLGSQITIQSVYAQGFKLRLTNPENSEPSIDDSSQEASDLSKESA